MKILGWASAFVMGVLGWLGRQQAKREGEEAGKAQAMLIANQPLSVKMEEQFVTRREFERHEAAMDRATTKMEGLFAQTMQAIETQGKTTDRRIENQSKRLTEVIESVAKSANEGRGKLWKVVNATANDLAAVKAETNVARELGKFGDAIIATTVTKQPH